MIVADRLTKVYPGKRAIEDVSFEVGQGETVALIGPSGCGKSTLLKMAAGLVWPHSGRMTVAGREIKPEIVLGVALWSLAALVVLLAAAASAFEPRDLWARLAPARG